MSDDHTKSYEPGAYVAIISNTTLTILPTSGQATVVSADHPKFAMIRDAVSYGEWERALKMANPAPEITKTFAGHLNGHNVTIDRITNQITIDSHPLPDLVTQKALDFVSRGLSIDSVACFLSRLANNPSYQSRLQALLFLERTGFALMSTGHVLGYRGLTTNWLDRHSYSVNNQPGRQGWISMARQQVDDDRDVACSTGYHIGSFEYANNWRAGGKLIVCAVDPADIVAVPKDHNDEKMRVCRYLPVAECYTKLDVNVVWQPETIPGSKIDVDDLTELADYLDDEDLPF